MAMDILIFLGTILVVVGILLLLSTLLRGRVKASGGVLIMVGPVPLVVASDQRVAALLYVLAIATVLLGLLATLLPLLWR